MNAQRLLEANHVAFESNVYDETGAFHSADEAARLLGAPSESVYKTMVILREALRAKPLLVMIASNREVDLRSLARSLGEKKLKMASLREAERLTGLQAGGISALALTNKGFDIYIDRTALELDELHVSGGARGLDIRLRVSDLVSLTGARPVDATTIMREEDRADEGADSLV